MDDNDDTVGKGMVGAPACGDVMRLQIKVNAKGAAIQANILASASVSKTAVRWRALNYGVYRRWLPVQRASVWFFR